MLKDNCPMTDQEWSEPVGQAVMPLDVVLGGTLLMWPHSFTHPIGKVLCVCVCVCVCCVLT